MEKNLGRVSPLFKGDYNNKERYEQMDSVYYNGHSASAHQRGNPH